MIKPITEKQQIVLDACIELEASLKRFPSLREIGERMNFTSTKGTRDYLEALVRKGALIRTGEHGIRRSWGFPKKDGDKAISLLRRVGAWEEEEGNTDFGIWSDIKAFLEEHEEKDEQS